METTKQLAKHLREVHFGGNWTAVNLKDALSEVDWQTAVTKFHSCNTIAGLVYHIHYYIHAVLKVFKGGPLDAHDRFSFDLSPIRSQQDWDRLLQQAYSDAEELAEWLEQFPESRLEENFTNEKYGNYYRNVCGLVEHTHYHLGQIVLIKKFLKSEAGASMTKSVEI